MEQAEQRAAPSPVWLLAEGQMFAHFWIMRPLGRGGMAEVYLARDTMLGRKVALKLVHREALGSREAIDRFLLEARTTAKFNHPHIITIYAVGEDAGKPYVALEYLEGHSLRQRLDRARPSVAEALRIALAIAEALKEAHANGVLHRDLKPENVMLAKDGRLRVLDFGLAKLFRSPDVALADTGDPSLEHKDQLFTESLDSIDHGSVGQGGIRGTPAYMAPEQWKGEEIGAAADIWGLGMIGYEMLTGHRPFGDLPFVQHCLRVCDPEPVPPIEHQAVGPELADLVEKCLRKNPEQRPTAEAVVQALKGLLSQQKSPLPSDESPFRGLLPFDERHRHLFFGRDSEIALFIERLREEPLLPLVGPSGAGKSSFVQAGVIPRLGEQGPLLVIRLHPGSKPFEALAAQIVIAQRHGTTSSAGGPFGFTVEAGTAEWLAREAGAAASPGTADGASGVARLAQQLGACPTLLNLVLHRLAERRHTSVLLFIDQLEELYTLVPDPSMRQTFMQAICAAADDPQLPVRVVLTLREEFLSRLTEGSGVREAMSHVAVLRSPSTEVLCETLSRPVEAVGYHFDDPALVADMVSEVQGEDSCLPLLQFAGQILWERRDKNRKLLLRSSYQEMGGVAGALVHHADGVLAGLSSSEVQLARTIFLRLITPEGTRRVLSRSRVLEGLGEGAEAVLRSLVEARLISVSQAEEGGQAELELVHESLVAAWGRLRRWIDESRDELVLLAEIEQAAELWQKRGRRADEVWWGDGLRDARRTIERCTTQVRGLVREFLEAGWQREQRRLRRRRVLLGGGFVLLALVALVLAAQNREARLQRNSAEARRLEAEVQRAAAQREGAHAALMREDVLEARAKLRGSLETQDSALARVLWGRLSRDPLVWSKALGASLYALAFSPDGKTIAVGSGDRSTYVFDAQTRALLRILRGHRDYVFAVSFSPDGRLLATGSWDSSVRLWRASDGSPLRSLEGHRDRVYGVAFSPDGRLLASASRDATIRLWSVESGALLRSVQGSEGTVYQASFSPDGKRLASAGADRSIRLWEVETGAPVRRLDGHTADVLRVRFSPDGRELVSASRDATVRLWDAATGAERRVLAGHTAPVSDACFSPDGRLLASTGFDRTVRIWEAASGAARRVLAGHAGDVWGVSFSPDGRLLASASYDKTLRLWEARRGAGAERPTGHLGEVTSASFSPDSRLLASGGWDRSIRLWDVASGEPRRVLEGHSRDVWGVTFGPDGRLLASASLDGSVRLWDLASGQARQPLTGHTAEVWEVTFSPDGRRLASASADRTLRVWDVPTGAALRVLAGHTGPVWGVSFSPDGQLLASSSSDKSVRLWRASTGTMLRAMEGHTEAVRSVGWSSDGRQLASCSNDGTVRLWNVQTGDGKLLGARPGARLNRVAFHPDGRRLGAASSDGRAIIWDLETGASVLLEGHTGEANSIRFSADGKLAATASDDGTVRLWQIPSGRPFWRAPALLGLPPGQALLLSHRGWRALRPEGPRPALELARAEWSRAVESRARLAAVDETSGTIALASEGGDLEIWDRRQDRRLAVAPLPGVRQLLALPGGALSLGSSGKVLLHRAGRALRELVPRDAGQLARGSGEILVAAGRRILVFDEEGNRRPVSYAADIDVTALTPSRTGLIVGYRDGNVELVSRITRQHDPSVSFENVASSPVARLLEGPMQTVVIGFGNGVLGLWDQRTGIRLDHTRLHGPIIHLLLRDGVVYAATGVGDHRVWDLGVLHLDRCRLLRDVWRAIPYVWEGGRPVLRLPPRRHPCAAR